MSSTASLSFFDHFNLLTEPRVERTKYHPLPNIVFMGVCAMLGGANDFVGMEKFGKSKRSWFEKYLDLSNGIPSHDTFGRVIQALDPQQFIQCFLSWVRAFGSTEAGRQVAIDGKTVRASLDRPTGQNPLHVVSAWAREARLVLGEVAVDEKSNEITAIPKLLELLELSGAVVTIDAMGCQKKIAAKIRERGADYVLAVKGNQEHLEEDMMDHFAKLDEKAEQGRVVAWDRYETKAENRHGRPEQRRCEACAVPASLRKRDEWPDLRSICRVTRIYQEQGVEKSEVRYFISSLAPKAQRLAQYVRGHWGVENGLHWVLDMTFAEDRSRARKDHAQENLAVIRRWTLSVLRQDTSMKASIEKKRLMAGWNESNLEKLLSLF